MLAPRLGEAPYEHVFAGIEEDDAIGHALAVELAQLIEQVAEDLLAADIQHERDLAQAAAGRAQLGELGDQTRREIVDAEVAEILKALRGLALTGARQARDDDEVRLRGRLTVTADRGLPLETLRGHVSYVGDMRGGHPPRASRALSRKSPAGTHRRKSAH